MQGTTDDMQGLARRLVEPLRAWFLGYDTGYQEGTYTPTYYGATTPGTTTHTVQSGEWIRVGNMVTVWVTITWTAATGTGAALVSLPFAARNALTQRYPGAVRASDVTYGGDWLVAVASNGADFVSFQTVVSAGGVANIAVEAAGTLAFTFTYPI